MARYRSVKDGVSLQDSELADYRKPGPIRCRICSIDAAGLHAIFRSRGATLSGLTLSALGRSRHQSRWD